MIQELKEQIEKEKQERANKCFEEVTEILKKYNCYFDPVFFVTSAGIKTQTLIVAKDE